MNTQAPGSDEVAKWTGTIAPNGQVSLKKTATMREALDHQVRTLEETLADQRFDGGGSE
jgi:hypothetical protein